MGAVCLFRQVKILACSGKSREKGSDPHPTPAKAGARPRGAAAIYKCSLAAVDQTPAFAGVGGNGQIRL